MSPTPILLAFLLAMVLFGGWVYFAVRESMSRDLTDLRAQPAVHSAAVVPPAVIEDLSELPVRDPERVAWRGRMLIHAGSCAIAVLLVLGLAVDGERVPNVVRP